MTKVPTSVWFSMENISKKLATVHKVKKKIKIFLSNVQAYEFEYFTTLS